MCELWKNGTKWRHSSIQLGKGFEHGAAGEFSTAVSVQLRCRCLQLAHSSSAICRVLEDSRFNGSNLQRTFQASGWEDPDIWDGELNLGSAVVSEVPAKVLAHFYLRSGNFRRAVAHCVAGRSFLWIQEEKGAEPLLCFYWGGVQQPLVWLSTPANLQRASITTLLLGCDVVRQWTSLPSQEGRISFQQMHLLSK